MLDAASVASYLISKGVSPVQAQGIVMNVADESAFNPSAVGDSGQSYGLFQHYGPRQQALFRASGTNTPTWQQQIDYALSEPDMTRYLSRDYGSPGEAAVAFLRGFERPAEKHARARERKYLGDTRTGENGMPTSTTPSHLGTSYSGMPAIPGMPALPQPDPWDSIANSLIQLGAIFGGVGSPMGAAVASNQLGGYGNQLAQYELAMKMQDTQYQRELAQWEAQQAQEQRQWQRGAPQRELDLLRQKATIEEETAAAERERQIEMMRQAGLSDEDIALSMSGASDAVMKNIMRNRRMETMPDYGLSPDLDQAVRVGDMEPDEAIKEERAREQNRMSRIESTTDDFMRESAPEQERQISWANVADMDPETMDQAQELVLINTYAKMLDPTSYVAEGEARTVADAGDKFYWLPDWARRHAKSGKRFTPEQSSRLMREMQRQAGRSYSRLVEQQTRYGTRLRDMGVEDPSLYLRRIEPFNAPEYLGGIAETAESGLTGNEQAELERLRQEQSGLFGGA